MPDHHRFPQSHLLNLLNLLTKTVNAVSLSNLNLK